MLKVDFRSEHGLYSMIQAQYDAALENPPWEINDYDIDDRPKKKRRVTERYYYELVTADGVRVNLPPEEPSELPLEQPSQPCSRPPVKETPVQSEVPTPAPSRRSSRRHVSLVQDNFKNESSKPTLKSQTLQIRRVSLPQPDSINESPIPPPRSQNARARNGPLAQDDSKNESPKLTSKGSLPRVRFLRACDRCRVRKIKCGEVRPCCEACTKAGVECITTENPNRRVSRNEDVKSQEDIAPTLEMELDSESSNTEEKASQQLLQESNEYSSQYASENSRLPEDVGVVDSKQKHTRRSLRTNSPFSFTREENSIATRIRSDSSLSNSLRRESSIRSTIQASITNPQPPLPEPRKLSQRSSSQIPSSENSIIESRSSLRQSIRSRADSLPPQLTQQSSSLRRSSRRNTPAFELPNSKLSTTTNVEDAFTASSATPSISSSDCSSSNKRNFLSEVSSTTTASESEEPPSQSSQSTSSRTLPNLKGKDLFDSVIWSDPFSTSIFYMFISNFRRRINNDVKSTTTTHQFIRALRDNGRLVRNYTQNIDCLEEREGLTTDLELGAGDRTRFQTKVQGKSLPVGGEGRGKDTSVATGVECVMLHGSLSKLRCGVCSKLTSWDEDDRETITMAGSAPDCPSCISSSLSRQDKGRRGLAVGRLRPDIVLYGEEHPHANLVGPLIIHDLKLGPDVLLILGTSLRVHGLKIMVKEFAQAVHARGGSVIFVNQTKPPESQWGDVIDYWVEWDCDAWVLDLKKRRSDIWLPYTNATQSVASKDPASSKQRSNSEKIPAYRPQCKRDDKTNAVYFTYKILDDLRKLKDTEGNGSVRPVYWQPFDRRALRASTGQIPEQKPTEKSRPPPILPPIKKARKSLPASSHTKQSSAVTVSIPQKRQTTSEITPIVNTPSTEPPRNGAWLGDVILKNVRKLTNNTLPESFFDDLRTRVPFERLAGNVPGNSIGYKRSFGDVGVDGGLEGIGLPNMRGLMDSSISIKGMSLTSLPPTGSPESVRKDKGKGKMVDSGERAGSPLEQNTMVVPTRPALRHSYGTRSKRSSRIGGEGVEVEDGDARHRADTIVVRGRDRMSIGAVCNDR
ncbi:NAD-dependent deacetylase hst3 [Ciborinia camelliae]|nr:NAD-dependent deacetylase hst3 [Ciborinia camelliae]